MSIYKKLDAALIDSIKSGNNLLHIIQSRAVSEEARRVAFLQSAESWRIIDRRLQALRKANKIVYSSKTGWTVVREVSA